MSAAWSVDGIYHEYRDSEGRLLGTVTRIYGVDGLPGWLYGMAVGRGRTQHFIGNKSNLDAARTTVEAEVERTKVRKSVA